MVEENTNNSIIKNLQLNKKKVKKIKLILVPCLKRYIKHLNKKKPPYSEKKKPKSDDGLWKIFAIIKQIGV